MPTQRRLLSLLPALSLLAAAVAAVALGARPAHAATTDRIAGTSRIGTAAELGERAFPDGASTALLARAGDFPDALAASALSAAEGGPVLLTFQDDVPDRTLRSLESLGVGRVILLGGDEAIGAPVRDELEDDGYVVDRIPGQDRFQTALRIARRVGSPGIIGGQSSVFIAVGDSFADALSAGPLAFAHEAPVLLTAQDHLPASTRQGLQELAPERAIVLGGQAAISDAVEREIGAVEGVSSTLRLSGRDRTDTAVQVAEFAEDNSIVGTGQLVLSRGDAFPDALAAAPYAGMQKASIVLSRAPDALSYDLLQFLVDRGEETGRIVAVGGTEAVSDRILQRTSEAASPPDRTITYEIGARGNIQSNLAYFAEHADWSLTDQRGWALDGNDIRFSHVADNGDFRLLLATPGQVDAASPACSAEWSCRVGDDVYINERRWNTSTETFRGERSLGDYRHYVVLHEVGHWLGLDHFECADHQQPGQPAPVMDQQSIDTGACTVNVWPLQFEQDRVRATWLGGAGSAETGSDEQEE